jgi:hypothetical protein
MQDGECLELATLERPTREIESGFLLPTPRCHDAKKMSISEMSRKSPCLAAMVMWPTPMASDGNMTNNPRKDGRQNQLPNVVKHWPTPRSQDAKHGSCTDYELSREKGKDLLHVAVERARTWPTPVASMAKENQNPRTPGSKGTQTTLAIEAGGSLNPTWVEKLMGWPQNWTEAKPMIDFQFISWIMGFCECKNTRTKEVMRVLRNSNGAQNFQRKAGRPISIQEAEILLSLMFQHKIRSDEAWLLMEGAEANQGEVRGVRIQSGVASSPHRSGHQEQPTGEHPNPMQTLPRLLAYDGEAAWKDQSWENAVPRVATGVASRVDRLKAIGNGQVPAVAALAFQLLSTNQETK